LSDEKIDVIEWSNDPVVYIAKALSPARVTGVYLDDYTKGTKTATVVVPEDQLSLAIGRDGQNARLAAKLTSWRIDIKSLPEAAVDAIYKLQNDPEFAQLAQQEEEVIPQIELILAKKTERRPVTPEEYKELSKFVDRVEQGLMIKLSKEREAEEEERRIIQANIPEAAYDIPIEETGISLRFCNILGGAGYTTVGDLMLQMELNKDVILALEGIGPKAIEEVEEVLSTISFPEPEVEPEPEMVEEELREVIEPAEDDLAGVEVIEEPVAIETEIEVEEIASEESIEATAPEAEMDKEELEEAEKTEEEPSSFDELFAIEPSAFEMDESLEYDEEDDIEQVRSKKKKKKKKYIEMEYDPDKDVVVVKKKRKRSGSEDWSDDWEI
jgi:N utilization substance protein A